VYVIPSPAKTEYVVASPQSPTYVSPYARSQYSFEVILGNSGHPSGPWIPIHTGPDATTGTEMTVYDGQYVSVDCQTYGGSVFGDWGTTTLWDRVVTTEQVIGYISDEWVHTGSDSQVLPAC
jgi:hypothetical protein